MYRSRNGGYNDSRYNRSNNYGSSSSHKNGGSSSKFNQNHNSQKDYFNIDKPVWNLSELKPIEKNIYKEHPDVQNRQNFIINDFLNKNNIIVTGDRFIKPIFSFHETNFPDKIMQIIKEQNFSQPTIIQSMCWPTLLSGHDIVGIAQTGSGKTLGFVLPLLMHILNHRKNNKNYDDLIPPGPIGLIIAPTRELALQIQEVTEMFGRPLGINNMCIYGGASKGPQMDQMARGADICIATPGRLLDFMKDRYIQFCDCTYLVLDEADRMLDMGFEPQITKIIQQTRPDRQTAMFSATWPKEVRNLAEDFLANYIHITIGISELTANPNIKQIIEVCDEKEKETRLKRVLRDIMNSFDSKVIIFAETKRRVDSFSKYIRKLGYYCLTIHGDKKQNEREWVLNEFRTKSKSILVATDVAARGLNIEDIKYVINIDFPNNHEDYIHRIGRTARSSNTGTAFTFITKENAQKIPKLIEILRETNQDISRNLLDLVNLHKSGFLNNKKNHNNNRNRPSRFSNNYNNDYKANNNQNRDYNDNYNESNSRKRPASEMINSSTNMNRDNDNDNSKRVRYSNNIDKNNNHNDHYSNRNDHKKHNHSSNGHSSVSNTPQSPPSHQTSSQSNHHTTKQSNHYSSNSYKPTHNHPKQWKN